jgi:hypothetical protein
MGRRIDSLVETVRREKGPFFIARLCLRLEFDIAPGVVPDSDERERHLIEACRMLGYDMEAQQMERMRR